MLPLKNWLRRFTHTHVTSPPLDNEAIVVEIIEPTKTGRVEFQGTTWLARCSSGAILQPDQVVYVIRCRNTTLYVEPTPIPVDAESVASFWICM